MVDIDWDEVQREILEQDPANLILDEDFVEDNPEEAKEIARKRSELEAEQREPNTFDEKLEQLAEWYPEERTLDNTLDQVISGIVKLPAFDTLTVPDLHDIRIELGNLFLGYKRANHPDILIAVKLDAMIDMMADFTIEWKAIIYQTLTVEYNITLPWNRADNGAAFEKEVLDYLS